MSRGDFLRSLCTKPVDHRHDLVRVGRESPKSLWRVSSAGRCAGGSQVHCVACTHGKSLFPYRWGKSGRWREVLAACN
jgi:hypothetical protein